MVLVSTIEQKITHVDARREKAAIAEARLGRLVGNELGAGRRGRIHELRQHPRPEGCWQFVLNHGLCIGLKAL
jgi:hypothetical protein